MCAETQIGLNPKQKKVYSSNGHSRNQVEFKINDQVLPRTKQGRRNSSGNTHQSNGTGNKVHKKSNNKGRADRVKNILEDLDPPTFSQFIKRVLSEKLDPKEAFIIAKNEWKIIIVEHKDENHPLGTTLLLKTIQTRNGDTPLSYSEAKDHFILEESLHLVKRFLDKRLLGEQENKPPKGILIDELYAFLGNALKIRTNEAAKIISIGYLIPRSGYKAVLKKNNDIVIVPSKKEKHSKEIERKQKQVTEFLLPYKGKTLQESKALEHFQKEWGFLSLQKVQFFFDRTGFFDKAGFVPVRTSYIKPRLILHKEDKRVQTWLHKDTIKDIREYLEKPKNRKKKIGDYYEHFSKKYKISYSKFSSDSREYRFLERAGFHTVKEGSYSHFILPLDTK